jgi:hypothetical protein
MNYFYSRVIQEDISKIYKIGKELGQGAFGTVIISNKRSYKYKKFAIKVIHRD